MDISCNIDDIISFLIDQRDEGYKTVELIDDIRSHGWKAMNPKISFIFNDHEPTVLGIDARSVNMIQKFK